MSGTRWMTQTSTLWEVAGKPGPQNAPRAGRKGSGLISDGAGAASTAGGDTPVVLSRWRPGVRISRCPVAPQRLGAEPGGLA